MIIAHTDSLKYKVLAISALMVGAILLTLYLAGYFFLMKVHSPLLPPYLATPYTVIDYWQWYGHEPYTRRWLTICFIGGAIPALIGAGALLRPVQRSLHGDARFATLREVENAGLFGESGLILGRMGRRFVVLGKQLGAICAAPPRSGKGAGLAQPNALSWLDSLVVLDIRKECWRITAGWRSIFSKTFLFDPLSEDGLTAQWNPLSYVRNDPVLRINDLQKIGNMLSPDPAHGDVFWPASSRDLFLGLCLYIFETPELPRTLGEVVRQIMFGEDESISDHWASIIKARDTEKNPLSDMCKAMLYDFIKLSAATQSSVRKTFTAKLQLWNNPLIDGATSGDSFDLSALRKEKISIYIGVNPGDMGRLSLLLNLFFSQMFDLNMREMPEDNISLKYQVLALMDEFTAMGRMPIFADSIGFMGGYNIRPFIIVQSLSQLIATYGKEIAETIITCCGAMVSYAPKEQIYAEMISKMLGTTTAEAKSSSRTMFSGKLPSVSTSAAARPLLNPQEVKQIGVNNEIIFMENILPIFCKKIWYWKLSVFKKRANLPLPVITPIVVITPTSHIPEKKATPAAQSKPRDGKDTSISVTTRPFVVADMATIDTLSLTDYAADFAPVVVPKGAVVSDADMKSAVDSFMNTVKQAQGNHRG